MFDNSFKPKILDSLQGYNLDTFLGDFTAAIVVAIIALPLSIALAIASGVGPNEGLYTAIVAGFVVSLLGGTKIQISGPTAALSSIIASAILKHGIDTLIVATIVAGVILIIFGFLRVGVHLAKIPNTIVIGFTSGVALGILVGQSKDFFGVTYLNGARPIGNIEKIVEFFRNIQTFNPYALLIGLLTLILLIVFPKISKKIPASLIAILISTIVVKVSNLNVLKISDLYAISNSPMTFHAPKFVLLKTPAVYTIGITIACLIAVEAILACKVSDKLSGDYHHGNAELIAQGLGSIASVLFGGIPATGALARTSASVKNGAKTPIASMLHSIILFLILIGLMKYVGMIPMSTIAALLFVVAYNMTQLKTINGYIKDGNKKDIAVLFTCLILTFALNLIAGISVALILWLILNRT
jgi:SulP family sulfate permease